MFRKWSLLAVIVFIDFLVVCLFFSDISSAQIFNQTAPTQPSVIVVNPKPAPNHTGCTGFNAGCVPSSYAHSPASDIFNNFCGFDYEYFELADNSAFPCNGGEQPEEGVDPDFPINCFSCTCPSGSMRIDGICVIDQGCSFGIQDFVTGQCFSPLCPFGDGTPENCGLAPTCIQSENSILLPATNNSPAACVCPFSTTWNASQQQCMTPLCQGFDGSPYNSVFNLSTNTCECEIGAVLDVPLNTCINHNCPVGQVFSDFANECVTGKRCPKNYDLRTSDNVCYKITDDSHTCDLLNQGSLDTGACGSNCWISPQGQEDRIALAQQNCRDSKVIDYLEVNHFVLDATEHGFGLVDLYAPNFYTPQEFCVYRGGTYDEIVGQCLDGDIQPPVASRSSSSSSSRSSSSAFSEQSSSESSSSSASSLPFGGGGGGASTPSGGGGEGGGGETGGGGGGGSGTGSAASQAAQNSSAANASVAPASAQASSAFIVIVPTSSHNQSTANSQSNNSSGANASSGSGGGSGGTGGGSGGTGGGTGEGGSNGSAGSNISSQANNNSSAGAGECDPESSGYLDCIGKNKKPFPAHTVTQSGYTTIDEVHQHYINRVSASPLVTSFTKIKNIMVVTESACPPLSIDLTDTLINAVLSTTLHCDLMLSFYEVLNIVTMIGWSLAAFRIFASA